MAEHVFKLKADWAGGRNDSGTIHMRGLQTAVSIPPEMNGPGIGTNPDEMLLGAAATCYMITLAAMMEASGLKKQSLALESEGHVEVTNNVITYRKIVHKPCIVLESGAADREFRLARRLTEKAEASCMISRALKGNVAIFVKADIQKKVTT